MPWTSTRSFVPALRVQAVDVLRDDRVEQAAGLELGQRLVGRVGLLVAQGLEAVAVELPEALRVAPEHVDVGDLHRVDVLPQPRARGAEVGDPRGHGDPRAGQRDGRAGLASAARRRQASLPALRTSGWRLPRNAPIPSFASSRGERGRERPASRPRCPSSRSPLRRHLLDLPDGDRRLARELARPVQGRVEQLLVGHDPVDEPELVGLLGPDRVARRGSSRAPCRRRRAAAAAGCRRSRG